MKYTHILTDDTWSSVPILTDDPEREERETVAACGEDWRGMAQAFERLSLERVRARYQLPGLEIPDTIPPRGTFRARLWGWRISRTDGTLYYSGLPEAVTSVTVHVDGDDVTIITRPD